MIGRPKILGDPVAVNIRMERDTRQKLEKEARDAGASISSRIRRIIEDHFDGAEAPVVSVLR